MSLFLKIVEVILSLQYSSWFSDEFSTLLDLFLSFLVPLSLSFSECGSWRRIVNNGKCWPLIAFYLRLDLCFFSTLGLFCNLDSRLDLTLWLGSLFQYNGWCTGPLGHFSTNTASPPFEKVYIFELQSHWTCQFRGPSWQLLYFFYYFIFEKE